MIQISPKHLQVIRTYGEKTYPEECCGLLLGKQGDNGHKLVVEVWETENSWDGDAVSTFSKITELGKREASKYRSFTIAPQDMLKAQKYAHECQLRIMGIYHSHPDYDAMPSEFDRAVAWQEYSYVIVSVLSGKATDVRSWVLDEHYQFVEEKLSVSKN